MTDRVRTLTVLLDEDFRTDDVESIMDGLRMIKYVREVKLGEVVGHASWRASDEYRREMSDVLFAIARASTGMRNEHEAEFLCEIKLLVARLNSKSGY